MKSPSFWLKLRCSSLINGQQSNRKSPLLWNALFKFQQLLGDITCGLLVPASLGIMRLSLHIQQDIDIVSLPRQCSKPFLRTTVHHLARHLNSQVSLQLCSAFFSLNLCSPSTPSRRCTAQSRFSNEHPRCRCSKRLAHTAHCVSSSHRIISVLMILIFSFSIIFSPCRRLPSPKHLTYRFNSGVWSATN